jgi:hypothetical protein
MAKLPNIQRILREDIPDAPAWIDKVITPVNNAFEALYSALAGNVTLADNLTVQVKTLTINTTADYGTGSTTTTPPVKTLGFEQVKFARTLKNRATQLWLGSSKRCPGPTRPSRARSTSTGATTTGPSS